MNRRGVMAGLGLAGLWPRSAIAQSPLDVVATTGMIADTVRAIGGSGTQVRGLMGPGVDPHSYRQTRTDIRAMVRGDLMLWHGLYLEAQMESFFEALGRQRSVRAVAEAVPKERLLAHDDYAGRYDPHVWMDPDLWAFVAEEIARILRAEIPGFSDEIALNAEGYMAELTSLSRYGKEVLATVPEQARVLVTAHDAFNYFGRAHEWEVAGIQGISTDSEAGIRRIADLVSDLVERKIAAVFVESSVSDRAIRALIEGAAARGHEVRIGGALYSDAMGRTGSYEGTYLGMIDHNVTTIARALGGRAPEGGRLGRLATV